jgi:hypothetical protein
VTVAGWTNHLLVECLMCVLLFCGVKTFIVRYTYLLLGCEGGGGGGVWLCVGRGINPSSYCDLVVAITLHELGAGCFLCVIWGEYVGARFL